MDLSFYNSKNILHNQNKNYGFTLAEVLITLGVIGVVAALTLPILIERHQKQVTVTLLKKAYTTLSQAFVSSVADNGNANDWVDTNVLLTEENVKKNYFNLYWAPYLKDFEFCTSQESCGYNGRPKAYNGNYPMLNFFGGKRISILTADGMYMLFRSVGGVSGSGIETFSKRQEIFVDINAGKGPNVYGKDIFLLMLDLESSKILPYGYSSPESYVNEHCYGASANDCFTTCATRIMRDGWKINYY